MRRSEPTPADLARLSIDVLPRMMRVVAASISPDEPPGLMSMTQFHVLKRLASRPWLGSELAHELNVSAPTVSAAVDSLVRRELVERGEPEGDRRAVPLRLTAAGARSLAATQERFLAALTGILGRIDPDERAALARGLSAIGRVLDGEAPRGKRAHRGDDRVQDRSSTQGPRHRTGSDALHDGEF